MFQLAISSLPDIRSHICLTLVHRIVVLRWAISIAFLGNQNQYVEIRKFHGVECESTDASWVVIPKRIFFIQDSCARGAMFPSIFGHTAPFACALLLLWTSCVVLWLRGSDSIAPVCVCFSVSHLKFRRCWRMMRLAVHHLYTLAVFRSSKRWQSNQVAD